MTISEKMDSMRNSMENLVSSATEKIKSIKGGKTRGKKRGKTRGKTRGKRRELKKSKRKGRSK